MMTRAFATGPCFGSAAAALCAAYGSAAAAFCAACGSAAAAFCAACGSAAAALSAVACWAEACGSSLSINMNGWLGRDILRCETYSEGSSILYAILAQDWGFPRFSSPCQRSTAPSFLLGVWSHGVGDGGIGDVRPVSYPERNDWPHWRPAARTSRRSGTRCTGHLIFKQIGAELAPSGPLPGAKGATPAVSLATSSAPSATPVTANTVSVTGVRHGQ